MTNNIKVYMKAHDRADDNADAIFEVELGDNIMTISGDNFMVKEAAVGISHLFFMDVNNDTGSTYDFVGEIRRERDGRLPSGEVRLERMMDRGIMASAVQIRIGTQSMKYGCRKWEEAERIAKGFVEILGLPSADRSGKRFFGPLNIASLESSPSH